MSEGQMILERIRSHFRAYRSMEYFRVFYLLDDPDCLESPDALLEEAVLRLVPLEAGGSEYYLLVAFSEELRLRAPCTLRLVHAERISGIYLELLKRYLETRSETLRFWVDLPVRPYYRGRFTRLLYPSVLMALVLNYYSSRVDSRIFPRELVKDFISQVSRELKPVYMQGRLVKYFGRSYVVGRFAYLVNTSWSYYYLARFAEFLSRHMLTIPKRVQARLREILELEKGINPRQTSSESHGRA